GASISMCSSATAANSASASASTASSWISSLLRSTDVPGQQYGSFATPYLSRIGSGAGIDPVLPNEFRLARQRAGAVLGDRMGDAFQPLACGEVFPAVLDVPALGEFHLDGFHGFSPAIKHHGIIAIHG